MPVDVVISFDSTGSMNPAISEVRRKVQEFIDTTFASVADLRMAIINHGSYCDGDRLIDIHNFTTDKQALINFLRRTQNTHGCDMRHASYEFVLKRALSLNWQSDTRAMIMIGDCEPHPIGYPTYRNDIPDNGSGKVNIDWRDALDDLVNINVKVYPIQALNRRERTHFYTSLATRCGTPKLDLMQFGDVVEYLMAVIFSQKSVEAVEEYATELQSGGLFNRNIANMFNALLRTDKYAPAADSKVVTRYVGDSHDLKEVDPARFQVLHVDHNIDIKGFVLSTGALFKVGRGFYELTKPEEVQERKEVVLVDRRTGDMWSGKAARDMIGLPYGERGKVRPKFGFDYDVFIQSTSANRKLIGGTKFLYEAK